ncbi:hypothetical protein [Polaribacter sargassicola]|uniref:hypothetical protein n=1 Tax=Polaribacter sargassicola TaxID=2836891 RepID=UPI001F3F439C|nr:hypothetical protein [Polaribacter sp. DS7-9]MCG1036815.1 hypothetical protein [Polaribacter sp. DS7-9]
MKMTGMHSLSHTDDGEEICVVCDYAIENNLTPTITPDINDFEIENIEFIIQKEVAIYYNYTILSDSILRELFSRPPPFLV